MNADESEDENTEEASDGEPAVEQVNESDAANDDENFGDDFEEFEAGTEDEDFGDFDEATHQSDMPIAAAQRSEPAAPSVQSLPPLDIPYVSTLCAKILGRYCLISCWPWG